MPPSSVVILGADAVLAALPATPVQLALGCRALGFEVAFPASWGDELVAAACLERLPAHGEAPVILCACPHVVERITRAGDELEPWMLRLASPPVAVARYVRAAYGDRPVHITYVGSCPGAADASIDARLSPEELFTALTARGIVLGEQPELFDSVLPPDRRRHHSVPGGAPDRARLAAVDPERPLVEPSGDDVLVDLAQRLIAGERVLIDLAPRMGCACSGVLVAGGAPAARPALVALEPPRAHAPVLDASIAIDLAAPDESPRAGEAPRPTLATSPDALPHARASEPTRQAPVAPQPAHGHAAIREWTARELARRGAAVHRRAANAPPALRREDGTTVPRAFAARTRGRPRTPPPDPAASSSLAAHRTRGERAHLERIDGGAEAPRPRRPARRSVVIPLPSEPPSPVPPPPLLHSLKHGNWR